MGKLPVRWREVVLEALERLQHDDARGFEDTLWLGLGDAWWPLREMLARKGLIQFEPQSTYPSLTPRGAALLARSSQTGSERP
ncbi:MAG: hypothetical protein Kow0022_05340 [Phycisphaerales bacterium]